MNDINLLGFIVDDLKFSANKKYCNFKIKTNSIFYAENKKLVRTTEHFIRAVGDAYNMCVELKKGDKVSISGSVFNDVKTGLGGNKKFYTYIHPLSVDFVSSNADIEQSVLNDAHTKLTGTL